MKRSFKEKYGSQTAVLCKMRTHKPSSNKRTRVDLVYISKQAVLDILKDLKNDVGIGLCEYDAGYENGSSEMIDKIINKINAI